MREMSKVRGGYKSESGNRSHVAHTLSVGHCISATQLHYMRLQYFNTTPWCTVDYSLTVGPALHAAPRQIGSKVGKRKRIASSECRRRGLNTGLSSWESGAIVRASSS